MNRRQPPTRRHQRPDIEYTQPNRPVRPPHRQQYRVPGSEEPTQPHYPITMPPEPPRGRSHYQRYAQRKNRGSFLRRAFEVTFAVTLFVVMFSGLLTFMYIMAPPPRTNILILGLDTRPGEGTVTRSDTVIIATIDPDQPYMGMLSIPRDLYLEIPGYGEDRINAAHVYGENQVEGGGIALVQATIKQNFGVETHRYIRVNFEAFTSIIDAAGGVDIEVEGRIVDENYPTEDYGVKTVIFEPGLEHMDGERALIYARTRYSSSDFERAARQQQVISALINKLADPTNWYRLPAVYLAFTDNVETNLTLWDALALAPAAIWMGPDDIDRQVLTRDMARGDTVQATGASVLLPEWSLIDPLIDRMFGGS